MVYGISSRRSATTLPLASWHHSRWIIFNPFPVGSLRFEVVRQGCKMIHRERCQDAKGKVVAERREEMPYTIGSGSQTRSYLYQRDGFLFESPITWFSEKSRWDLSPGYENSLTHFHRPIEPRC